MLRWRLELRLLSILLGRVVDLVLLRAEHIFIQSFLVEGPVLVVAGLGQVIELGIHE